MFNFLKRRKTEVKVIPLPGQEVMYVPALDQHYVKGSGVSQYTPTRDINKANVLTSRVEYAGRNFLEGHKVVLDIDHPVLVLNSSTPGHHHLIIDKEISWKQYLKIMKALVDAGIVEPGYLGASESRGFTAVRLPWVRKPGTK